MVSSHLVAWFLLLIETVRCTGWKSSVQHCVVPRVVLTTNTEHRDTCAHLCFLTLQGFVLGDLVALYSSAKHNAFARVLSHW